MFSSKYHTLKKEYELLSMQFDNYKKTIEQEVSELPMVVDFEQMKVVSIERIIKNNTKVTVLGYISPNSAGLCEWALYCSEANHVLLVEQFRKYINGGK